MSGSQVCLSASLLVLRLRNLLLGAIVHVAIVAQETPDVHIKVAAIIRHKLSRKLALR